MSVQWEIERAALEREYHELQAEVERLQKIADGRETIIRNDKLRDDDRRAENDELRAKVSGYEAACHEVNCAAVTECNTAQQACADHRLRADSAEEERDELRAEVERLREAKLSLQEYGITATNMIDAHQARVKELEGLLRQGPRDSCFCYLTRPHMDCWYCRVNAALRGTDEAGDGTAAAERCEPEAGLVVSREPSPATRADEPLDGVEIHIIKGDE